MLLLIKSFIIIRINADKFSLDQPTVSVELSTENLREVPEIYILADYKKKLFRQNLPFRRDLEIRANIGGKKQVP